MVAMTELAKVDYSVDKTVGLWVCSKAVAMADVRVAWSVDPTEWRPAEHSAESLAVLTVARSEVD